jgi:hypothetical protein
VLGRRWVYDGCGDPVYVAALADAVLAGGTQAAELVDVGGRFEERPLSASVVGGGTPGVELGPVGALTVIDGQRATTVSTGGLELVVVRVLDPGAATRPGSAGAPALTGTWSGQTRPVLLARASTG